MSPSALFFSSSAVFLFAVRVCARTCVRACVRVLVTSVMAVVITAAPSFMSVNNAECSECQTSESNRFSA